MEALRQTLDRLVVCRGLPSELPCQLSPAGGSHASAQYHRTTTRLIAYLCTAIILLTATAFLRTARAPLPDMEVQRAKSLIGGAFTAMLPWIETHDEAG